MFGLCLVVVAVVVAFTFNINTFNLYDMTTTRFWGLD